jgi:hypothetical protein
MSKQWRHIVGWSLQGEIKKSEEDSEVWLHKKTPDGAGSIRRYSYPRKEPTVFWWPLSLLELFS